MNITDLYVREPTILTNAVASLEIELTYEERLKAPCSRDDLQIISKRPETTQRQLVSDYRTCRAALEANPVARVYTANLARFRVRPFVSDNFISGILVFIVDVDQRIRRRG